jgi:hypothetical protein
LKIAICTPYYANVTAEYARCLALLTAWTVSEANFVFNGTPAKPEIQVFMRRCTLLPRARNQLAKDAIDWNANYLLWIDGDHSFPRQSLFRLLSLNLPVVGANYPIRANPTAPCATALSGGALATTEKLALAGAVEEVAHLGLGFCLVDIRVIRALRNGKPLFQNLLWGEGTDESIGEDVHFFRRVREAGFKVHVDHGLSWDIRHYHQTALSNADI